MSAPPWQPFELSITSSQGLRSATYLLAVARQFDVQSAARYRGGGGAKLTYCNIFAWDFTRGMTCEVPHWFTEDGEPAAVGSGQEMTANMMLAWLLEHGPSRGWAGLARHRDATLFASLGWPTLALWRNPDGPGHVAVVLPSGNIAQAGARNFFDEPLSHGFGAKVPSFFTHQ